MFCFQENYYDSHYQQSRIVPRGRKFLRGDTLITECTYDSTSKDKPILGGYSAKQVTNKALNYQKFISKHLFVLCYSSSSTWTPLSSHVRGTYRSLPE